MDWIEESQRMVSIEENCLREPVEELQIRYYYIQKDLAVNKVIKETIKFNDKSSTVISKEKMLQMIQHHKISTSLTQYVLKDTFLFHIPIEPEVIGSFHESSYKQYWTQQSVLKDIDIIPLIFVFQPYSTLCFFYYEEDKPAVKSLKSALKTTPGHHSTKRVRWSPNHRHKSTRRKAPTLDVITI